MKQHDTEGKGGNTHLWSDQHLPFTHFMLVPDQACSNHISIATADQWIISTSAKPKG